MGVLTVSMIYHPAVSRVIATLVVVSMLAASVTPRLVGATANQMSKEEPAIAACLVSPTC